MKPSRRTRLAEGIFSDRYGLDAIVKVGSGKTARQRSKRFPFGTDLKRLQSWQIQKRAELDAARADQRAAVDTLREDGERFLLTKASLVGYKSERAHLRAWYPRFGALRRDTLTSPMMDTQLAAWRTAGVAALTVRHRCRLLKECYHALDGAKATTPLDGVKIPGRPRANPIVVPFTIVAAVARKLKKAGLQKDYARFLVRATTGQRPAQIMRTTSDMVDLTRKIWFVPMAKDGDPIVFPLDDDSIAAWRVFIKAHAWGPFDTWRAAKVLYAHGWPKDVKPYNARHSFAYEVLAAGGDLRTLQGLFGHRDIQTTQIYSSFIPRLQRAAVQARQHKLRA